MKNSKLKLRSKSKLSENDVRIICFGIFGGEIGILFGNSIFQVYDQLNETSQQTFSVPHSTHAIAFNINYIACVCSDESIAVIDRNSKEIIQTSYTESKVLCIELHPFEDYFITGEGDNYLRIYDLPKGAFRSKVHNPFTSEIRSFAFCVLGFKLLSGHKDGSICNWNFFEIIEDNKPNLFNGLSCINSEVTCISLLEDNTFVVGYEQGQISHWKPAGPIKNFLFHKSEILSIKLDSKSRRMISTAKDGLVIIWDFAKAEILTTYRNDSNILYSTLNGIHLIECIDRESNLLILSQGDYIEKEESMQITKEQEILNQINFCELSMKENERWSDVDMEYYESTLFILRSTKMKLILILDYAYNYKVENPFTCEEDKILFDSVKNDLQFNSSNYELIHFQTDLEVIKQNLNPKLPHGLLVKRNEDIKLINGIIENLLIWNTARI